ncbi:MAG: ATP-binding protein, partial [Promethearchaeota archaeon]
KENKFALKRNKIFIFVLLNTLAVFLILNLPFFITNNSRLFLDLDHKLVTPTIAFNLSNIIFCASIILFLLVFFQTDKDGINLKIPPRTSSKRGEIFIGRVLKGKVRKHKFWIPIKDLEKHMFICGATGTGKSNFLMNFLMNFSPKFDIPFFLVEFKGEYHFLQNKIEDVLILWPGENFSINIFNPGNTSPIIHAERIFDILRSGQFIDDNSEYSPQMEKVLVEILTKVCQNKNFQNWTGFEHYCEIYLREKKNSIPMLSQTLISIKNRIRRFSKGPLKALFEENRRIKIQELLKRNIILDLSSIIRLGGEKDDTLFFLNMILKYLWDENLMNGALNFKGIKHLTIIEDAQYFAPQDFNKKNKLTTYLEDIALLQRGTGECLITLATRPDISKEILANNGIVLTFKNHIDKEIMCDLLNLNSEDKNFLSILEEGRCIIRTNSIKEPFLLEVPFIDHDSLTFTEIYQHNKKLLEKSSKNYNSQVKDKEGKNLHDSLKLGAFIKKIRGFKLKGSRKKNTRNKIGGFKIEQVPQDPKEGDSRTHLNNIERRALEDLERFVKDLYKIQSEKE